MTYAAPPSRLVLPMRGLTTTVTVFLAGWGLLALATIVLNVSGILTVGSGRDSDRDLVVFMALLGFFILYPAIVLVGIVFVIWLLRARENAENLSPYPHRHSRGWIVGGWLVPIVNLFFPQRIVADIWRASDVRQRPTGIVLAWWIGFLATVFGLPIPLSVLINTVDAEVAQSALVALVVLTLDGILAAGLAIAMVWRIASMQEELRQGRAPG